VRRIYRRACVLRATGKSEEATTLESVELPRALATVRSDPLSSLQEEAVLAEEVERVSSALILAELVAPVLVEQLRTALPVVTGAYAPSPTNKVEPKAAAAPPQAAADEMPSIADMIDGMLSQERASAARARS